MKGRFFLSLLIVLFATSAVAQTTSHRLQSSKHPDVSTSAPSNNQCLVYVAATGKWTPGSCSAGAGDVTKVGTPAQYYLGIWTGDGTLGSVAALGSAGNPLISGGAAANPSFLSVVLAGGTNTFSITNGTASLDVAAGATLNIDKSLQVATGAVVINGNAGGSSVLTLPNQTTVIGTLTDGKWCSYASSGTTLSCTQDAPAGSGDVTDVGDCSGGACYDGSSDGGTYARLYDGTSAYVGITAGVRTLTLAPSNANAENLSITFGNNDNSLTLGSSTGVTTLNLTGWTVNATSFVAAASSSPTMLLNDSDAPGTDKEIGKIVGGYVDGADGSENGTMDLYVHEAGTTTSYIQLDGKNTRIELNKDLLVDTTKKLQFGDTGTYINQSADGVLAVVSDTEIKLVANDEDLKITKTGTNGITVGTNTGVTTVTSALIWNHPLQATVVDGSTTSTDLTAAQVSGTQISNYGQTNADTFLILPTAAAGYNFVMTVGTAQSNHWCVEAGASDKIYLISAAGTIAAGDDGAAACFMAAQVGQSAACWTIQTGASAYDWVCKAIAIGTSTFEAHASSE